MVSPTVYELILEALIAPAISMCRSQATGESMTSITPAKEVTPHMRGLSGSRLNMTGHRSGILSEEITRKVEPCHGILLWNICRAVGSPRSCMLDRRVERSACTWSRHVDLMAGWGCGCTLCICRRVAASRTARIISSWQADVMSSLRIDIQVVVVDM